MIPPPSTAPRPAPRKPLLRGLAVLAAGTLLADRVSGIDSTFALGPDLVVTPELLAPPPAPIRADRLVLSPAPNTSRDPVADELARTLREARWLAAMRIVLPPKVAPGDRPMVRIPVYGVSDATIEAATEEPKPAGKVHEAIAASVAVDFQTESSAVVGSGDLAAQLNLRRAKPGVAAPTSLGYWSMFGLLIMIGMVLLLTREHDKARGRKHVPQPNEWDEGRGKEHGRRRSRRRSH
jgi:hypothetical protein